MNGAEWRRDEMLADAIGHRRRAPGQRSGILDGDLCRGDAEQGDRKNKIGRLRNATHCSHLNAHAHATFYIWSHFRRRTGLDPESKSGTGFCLKMRESPRNRTLIEPDHATR